MGNAFTPPPLVHGSVAELEAISLDDELMHGPVSELQCLLGYSFNDPHLLVEALTHPSHLSRPTYQRLEHVGDAALNLAFTNYLFRKNPTLEPEPLTDLRSANVCTEKFARVAVRHGLHRYVRRSSSVQDQTVEEFTQSVIQEDPVAAAAAAFGGTTIKAPKVLADIVESIAGAVYIDANYDLRLVWKVFKPLLRPIITLETLDKQPVKKLHELCEKLRKNMFFDYSIDTGEGDNMMHVVRVVVDGVTIAEGSSKHKFIAKLNVAREALLKLNAAREALLQMHDLGGSDVFDGEPVSQLTTELVIDVVCPAEVGEARVRAKHELHQLCRKKHWAFPVYKLETEEGPAHDKRFVASVMVRTPDNVFVMLSGLKQKSKEAENQAAFGLLLKLLNI